MPAALQTLAQVDVTLSSLQSSIDAEGFSLLAQADAQNKKCEAEAKQADG